MTLGHEGQFSSVLDPSPRGEGKGAQGMGEGGVIFGFWGAFSNSIAFGSAPPREADSQPISQLARPAVRQTETHSFGEKLHKQVVYQSRSNPAPHTQYPDKVKNT